MYESYRDLRIRWYHLSTIPGTTPHCLVSTGGDVNFLGTRNLVYDDICANISDRLSKLDENVLMV